MTALLIVFTCSFQINNVPSALVELKSCSWTASTSIWCAHPQCYCM